MLERCYSEKYQEKYPTYKNCTLDEKWYNFQIFAKWFENNYILGHQLDKDILIKGNKIYSPETCCFVPQEINKLFTKSEKARGSLPIGVRKCNKRYKAIVKLNGKQRHLGTFDTPEEAFNAYKIAKELHIKEVADRWKGQISDRTYYAMYNYQVEITD